MLHGKTVEFVPIRSMGPKHAPQGNMYVFSSHFGALEHCNIPNFQFGMLYIGHSCISSFISFPLRNPRNPKQLKDPRRELGISPVFKFDFYQILERGFLV